MFEYRTQAEIDRDKIIGANLRKLRKRRYKTAKRFAEAIGRSPSLVGKWERGENGMRASTFYLIARRLKVPYQAFFEGVKTRTDAPTTQGSTKALREIIQAADRIENSRVREALTLITREAAKRSQEASVRRAAAD